MRLQRQSDGAVIHFDPTLGLGAGGEARVFGLPGEARLVAKIYRKPHPGHASKLVAMLRNPPADPMAGQGHVSIAWPVDLLQTAEGSGRVVGFLMPRAAGKHSLIDYYNPTARRSQSPLFNYLYLHRTARNLAAAVRAVHDRGYVIGDVNETNLLVTDTALVTLVDTDSFQVPDERNGTVYRCPVGRPEFTPPELQGKTFAEFDRKPEHDLFGLAVLIFQLLMEGTHPFAGVYTGEGDPPPYEVRIQQGHFPHGTRQIPYRPMPAAPRFETLPQGLRALFLQCFEEGHARPERRPDAEVWMHALQSAEDSLLTCAVNDQHRYGTHLASCPWCARTQLLRGRDPFPSRATVQGGQHLPSSPTQTALPAVERVVSPAPAPRPASVIGAPPAPVPAPAYLPAPPPAPGRSGFHPGLIVGGVLVPLAVAAALVGPRLLSQSASSTTQPGRSAATQAAEAGAEVKRAEQLLDEVTASIRRNRDRELTESQAEQIRDELRSKCRQALTRADHAINLDASNADAWVLRVRAMRLSGDRDGAQVAVETALKQFPGHRALKEQQQLLRR